MVDAAYRAGVEVIKHQTHIIDDEMSKIARKILPGNANISIYDVMKNASLTEEEELELKKYVESKGMIFISTPFSRAAVERLERLGVQAYKVGSGECNNYPLIEHIAKKGKPMIVSTGMNNIKSIKKTVEILNKYNIKYALLHTTNLYPTSFEMVRLGAMKELEENFPDAVVGLSDHTVNNNACLAATALGASILERHFTDTMDRVGPDIICSADEVRMKALVEGTKQIFKMLGGKKEALKEEKVTMSFAFATVVTIRKIKKGETFTKENIWVKRPYNNGILAKEYENILGKIATQDIDSDMQLSWEMIGENKKN